jgi:GNAT superfamily N-acetyltransferase
MSAYRFCRTDDIALLVDALNRCWPPSAGQAPMTPAAFKRSIRDLQVWCSSCMVAFSGPDPIGVLIGAKRPSGTLVHTIAVRPDHRRQGHARHLLASLGAKLAILGPPRIVAEVPDSLTAACGLFSAGGYIEEGLLTDYVWRDDQEPYGAGPGPGPDERERPMVIPVTIDDLEANGLLDQVPGRPCWNRSIETLKARKAEIAGLAVASHERIEACILYLDDGEIVWLRSFVEDAGSRVKQLLGRLRAGGMQAFRLSKVHPAELPADLLLALGFHGTAVHRLFASTARPN